MYVMFINSSPPNENSSRPLYTRNHQKTYSRIGRTRFRANEYYDGETPPTFFSSRDDDIDDPFLAPRPTESAAKTEQLIIKRTRRQCFSRGRRWR